MQFDAQFVVPNVHSKFLQNILKQATGLRTVQVSEVAGILLIYPTGHNTHTIAQRDKERKEWASAFDAACIRLVDQAKQRRLAKGKRPRELRYENGWFIAERYKVHIHVPQNDTVLRILARDGCRESDVTDLLMPAAASLSYCELRQKVLRELHKLIATEIGVDDMEKMLQARCDKWLDQNMPRGPMLMPHPLMRGW